MTPTENTSAGAAAPLHTAARHWRPVAEWSVWIAIAALAWSQTGYFDRPIQGYALGATGWPRAICVMMVLGATGQLLYRLLAEAPDPEADRAPLPAAATGALKLVQRGAIFALPFVYLYAMPWVGFYVATPVFVVLLLLVLEVRSPRVIAAVTATVMLLALVVFTRFFYVALPVGRLDGFYEANEAIIDLARLGM